MSEGVSTSANSTSQAFREGKQTKAQLWSITMFAIRKQILLLSNKPCCHYSAKWMTERKQRLEIREGLTDEVTEGTESIRNQGNTQMQTVEVTLFIVATGAGKDQSRQARVENPG
jgi:hypothetical protein